MQWGRFPQVLWRGVGSSELLPDRKLELAHWPFRLDAVTILLEFENLMQVFLSQEQAGDPIPQSHLDAIAQSEVDLKEGRVITAEKFRRKYARYGI